MNTEKIKPIAIKNKSSSYLFSVFSRPALFQFPTIVIIVLHLAATTCGVESQKNQTDRLALLAIKSQLVDHHPQGVLSSWNQSRHHCLWEGVTCGRKHDRVITLNLTWRSLSGTISPSIGNMSFLRQLFLSNNGFHGHIPHEVGRLFRLQQLDLSNNTLVGEIPTNISGCINLEFLLAGSNKLGGKVPIELGALSKLKMLVVQKNNFIGPLFRAIANLTNLEQIYGAYNAFTGTIPDSIDRMIYLTILALGSNDLAGIIPQSIFNLSSLQSLDLAMNRLEGRLPQDIGLGLPRLTNLNLAINNLSGPLPSFITNLSSLQFIELSTNKFTWRSSFDYGHFKNLLRLSLSYNNLGGSINFVSTLVNSSDLIYLDLLGNDFTGMLPKSVVNLSTSLTRLTVGLNQLSGEIPVGFSNLVSLERLVLDTNAFSGTIPPDIGKLQNLEVLALFSNKLNGSIPSSFGNLSHLSTLHLKENKLQGNIAPSLGNCQNLLFLDLSNNDLVGTLPNELFGGFAKFLALDLSINHLEGSLPFDIMKQTNLVGLDVSENNLSGEIPVGLSNSLNLQYLHIQDNSFHGYIPASFSSLKSLQDIDLSHNNLSGSIPDYFSRFPLFYLNLSYNSFEGKVPTTGVFANASAISIIGNDRLCGGISQLGLPRCMPRQLKRRKTSRALKLIIPIICALVGVVMALLMYLNCYKRKRKSIVTILSMREPFLKVSYNMLVKATDGFSSENLLGSGTYGSVFKGILEPYGKTVAVKVLNLQCRGAAKSFMAECKALRNIRHRNLVGIITTCSSTDFQRNDFKALVYDFMPNGSLDRWLHDGGNLSLHQRIDIALDVACALSYLHHECETPIVHCDLKPSNILLDGDMVAHVGDFGLAKFLPKHQNPSQSSSMGIRGTIGYAAPEYGLGAEVSEEGDVYSYGILVLELMTGKRPSDNMFKEDFNLHVYAKAALPHQVLQIVDPILKANESEEANLRRSGQSVLEQRVECMHMMVEIGVACSDQSPQDRMKLSNAINELRKAKDVLFKDRQRRNFQRGATG